FQAEDGIRDRTVTGVQTCALPICRRRVGPEWPDGEQQREGERHAGKGGDAPPALQRGRLLPDHRRHEPFGRAIGCPRWALSVERSEERRVGKGGGWGRWR